MSRRTAAVAVAATRITTSRYDSGKKTMLLIIPAIFIPSTSFSTTFLVFYFLLFFARNYN